MMKLLGIAAALGLLIGPWPAWAADLGEGRISYIQGQAEVQPADAQDYQAASANLPVKAGDRFFTHENTRLELQFQNGTTLRLDQLSTLDVLALDDNLMQFHLSQGRLFFRSSHNPGQTIQVDSPNASLVVRDRALFRVDLGQDGSEEFGLYEGAMQIAAAGSHTRIRTGERLTLENGSAEVLPLKPIDEWEQWNTDRDEQIKTTASNPYLPPELEAYAGDLSANGDWVDVPDYGFCWVPRIGVSMGWAPYRAGRWVWINGDWVWVSAEPWGWAPYHYGRWLWFSNRWCWVPPVRGEVRWGPGFVGWIHTPRYVGWVPLAPGEAFDRNARGERHYHNLPHAGAATVVEGSVFAGGRVVPVRPKDDIFAPGRHVWGPPDARPLGRTHAVPGAGGPLPGLRVRSESVSSLRTQHPPLQVVPPQPRPFRSEGRYPASGNAGRNFTPRVQRSLHTPPVQAAPQAGGAVWGNRPVQRMWWVSPKAATPATHSTGNSGRQHGGNGGSFRGEGEERSHGRR